MMNCYRKIHVCMLAVCVLTSCSGLIRAENDVDTERSGQEDAWRLDEMTVTADQRERNLLQEPRLESPALDIALSSVDASTIRLQNARDLTEAMNYSLGIHTETRGRKVKQFTSFRGQVYPYPDYAVNGIWFRQFRELPYLFPAAAIDRIDIMRSGGGLTLGLSDITGVINVDLKQFDQKTTFIDADYGSNNTFETSVTHGDKFEKGYYTVGANYFRTDGPDDRNGNERMKSMFINAGFQPLPALELELTAFALHGSRELVHPVPPGRDIYSWRGFEEYDPLHTESVNLKALLHHSETAATEITLGTRRRSVDYEGINYKAGGRVEKYSLEDYEYTLGIMHSREITDSNTLRFGATYNRWRAPEGKRFYVGREMDIHSGALVLADEQELGRLTLDGAFKLRQNYYSRYAPATFQVSGKKIIGAQLRKKWGDPLWDASLGATYRLSKLIKLYSHATAGLLEAPPGAVNVKGNSLNDETRIMADAGLKMEKDNLGSVKMGGFYIYRDSALLLEDTYIDKKGNEFTAFENRDMTQYGVEMEMRSSKIYNLTSLYFTATAMESLEKRAGSYENRIELPDYIFTGGLYSYWKGFDCNLFGKYVSGYENKRYAADKKYHDLGDFLDLNLTVGYSFGKDKNSRVYVEFENMLDDKYSTVVGYPDEGFQTFVGFEQTL